jgi:hypothetical protein
MEDGIGNVQEEAAVLLRLQHDRGWGGRDGAGHEGAAPGGVAAGMQGGAYLSLQCETTRRAVANDCLLLPLI